LGNTERLLISLSGLIVLGIGAQWLAWRMRLPSILLLLICGLVAGPISGYFNPDKLLGDLLFPLVSLSVALILFEGGLSLRIDELPDIFGALGSLLTIGALVTWASIAAAARFVLRFDLPTSLLLGAILVVTGPTVVGPLLRQIRPVGRVGPIAKWEGIVIDPLGAVLAVLVFEASESVHAQEFRSAAASAAMSLAQTAAIGVFVGLFAGVILVLLLRRYWVPDYLQSPVALMLVVIAFTSSNLLRHEAGLVAVTVMGIVVANQKRVVTRHIVEFKENLRVLLLSTLFIVLAARIQPAEFRALSWRDAAFLAVVIVVVRPLSVLIATVSSGLKWREKALLAWLAPRGIVAAAVASIFALRMGEAGEALVPATFVVIIGTVAVYGLTAYPLARWLGLAEADPQGVLIVGAHRFGRAVAKALQAEGFPVLLVDSNPSQIAVARMEGVPTYCANILSEISIDELELSGIGRFLALTPNDELNSLAALHFSDIFGKSQVYQIVPVESGAARVSTAVHHWRGRRLFAADADYDYLDQRVAGGAVVKRTKLSDKFGFQAFKDRYGDDARVLFTISPAGKLSVHTVEQPPKTAAGTTLISLVDPGKEPPAK
jgi:NhaP-type Na+/H+ or K+/H+ antiporter